MINLPHKLSCFYLDYMYNLSSGSVSAAACCCMYVGDTTHECFYWLFGRVTHTKTTHTHTSFITPHLTCQNSLSVSFSKYFSSALTHKQTKARHQTHYTADRLPTVSLDRACILLQCAKHLWNLPRTQKVVSRCISSSHHSHISSLSARSHISFSSCMSLLIRSLLSRLDGAALEQLPALWIYLTYIS